VALRRRLSIIAAASVGIAILIAVLVSYAVVRSQLRGSIDDSLRTQATAIRQGNTLSLTQHSLASIPASAGGPAPYAQIVLPNAQIARAQGNLTLPVTAQCLQVAKRTRAAYFTDVNVGDSHMRMLTFAVPLTIGGTGALELARPLNSVDSTLSELRLILLFVLLGGVVVAGVLGRMASRRVLRPLNEVAAAAEHIAETDDLSERLRVHADDEVGSLATRFNTMLDRLQGSRDELDESVRAQRQLVADASHELRTPVTSLRTNIEVLLTGAVLDEDDRERLLTDVVEQSEELSALVNDLIELARGDQQGAQVDDVRLDRVVAGSIERARRNTPSVAFEAHLEPAQIDGVAERLERAVNNLLDNAARHSPPGGVVEVTTGPGGVEVRDHGRGVDEADLPHVFDRFYRGTNSRGSLGSGLGLAIVRQVTEQHGGTASVANAPDGGAVFTLSLPTARPDHSQDEHDRDFSPRDPRDSLNVS
jgi:two-component system, OmpR family, sensor histidine kinase MprB